MTEDIVPDLYELAFTPGCFRCPKCGFVLSKATLDVAHGRVGTTEQNRQSEPCPNDGTFMIHVTWKEQVEVYAERLKEALDERDALRAELDIERTAHAKTQEELACLRAMILGAIEAEAE